MILRWKSLLFVLVFLGSAAWAQAGPAARLDGDWIIAFKSGGVGRAYIAVFHPDGDSFSGSVEWIYGGEIFTMTRTSIFGDTFAFTAAGTPVTGRITSSGTLELKFVFMNQSQDVIANRVPGLSASTARQYEGVSQGKMGVYRALGRLAFEAVQKHDMHTAAMFAYLLDRAWDQGSGQLKQSNRAVWQQIESSIDNVVRPIVSSPYVPLDSRQFGQAYTTFNEKLSLAD